MAKKKGRRNNASGSSSFNARAKAQRDQRAREDNHYHDDGYSDDGDGYYARHDDYREEHHYHKEHHDYEDPWWEEHHHHEEHHRHEEHHDLPSHDHSRGVRFCPLCNLQAAVELLNITETVDKARTDDYLYSLNWAIYGGLAAVILLYKPSTLACESSAHWSIRWPWILSWHCMAVSCAVGFFLKYWFVKPLMNIYAPGTGRSVGATMELRFKLDAQLDKYMIGRLCGGVAVLFLLGGTLVVAGAITLVLGRFGMVLHGAWGTVKYIILSPLRLAKWILRRLARLIQHFVRLVDRVGRATGRNATKSGSLLFAFVKLYGRTLIKFSQSLLVFVIDLAKLLLLTAAATLVVAVFFVIYVVLSRLIFGHPTTPEDANDTHKAHGPSKSVPSPRPSDTPPPSYKSLDGDLPGGDLGKKKKKSRGQKAKDSVEAS